MILQVEPGTERYVSWARHQAARLDAQRRDTGVFAIVRTYSPEPGLLCWIKATEFGAHIRLTGGSAAGRTFRDSVNATPTPRRLYYVAGKVLREYGESTATPSSAQHLSVDGHTTTWRTADGHIFVSRRARTPAEVAGDLADAATPAPEQAACVLSHLPYTPGVAQPAPDWARPARGRAWCSDRGGQVTGLYQRLPRVVQVQQALIAEESAPRETWSPATTVSTVTEGPPADMLPRLELSGDQWHSFFDVTSEVPQRLTMGPSDIVLAAGYDRFADVPVALVEDVTSRLQTIVSFATVGGVLTHNYYVAYAQSTYELRAWRAGAWQVLWSHAFGDSYWGEVGENVTLHDSAVVSAGLLPGAGPMPAARGADVTVAIASSPGQDPRALWVRRNRTIAEPFRATNSPPDVSPLSQGATVDNLGGETLMSNDAEVWAAPADKVLHGVYAAAPRGYVVLLAELDGSSPAYSWLHAPAGGALARTAMPVGLSAFAMSPAGSEAWTTEPAYYELGVQKRSWGARPTADATSFATYGTPPPDGFWFVSSVAGWRYDKPATAKVAVSTHIERTPGTPGGSMIVQGGVIHVDLLGDISVPTNPSDPQDGFTLDGSLWWDGSRFWTEAELSANVGGLAVTFIPNGVTYDVTTAGTPDTYAWAEATVDLKWDDASGRFHIGKTYSEALVDVPSRGPLEETIPGATTIETSDAELLQDYLVPGA